MSASRFGFARRPFRPSPALELYVPLSGTQSAIETLQQAFANGDGVALLDGEPGTGKTIAALRLLEQSRTEAMPIYVISARFSKPAELHQAILYDLNQPYTGLSDQELRLAVTQQLLSLKSRAIIVIDEAQLLSHELLEEVRLLDNLESAGTKVAFIVLVALPELREQLAKPSFVAIAQRINCRCRLTALDQTQAAKFLRDQLEVSEGRGSSVFHDEAIALMAAHGGGVPRVLNQLASQCLHLAESDVDAEVVYEVLSQAGVTIPETEESAKPPYSAGAARSTVGERREHTEDRESGRGTVPKQKARSRRAA